MSKISVDRVQDLFERSSVGLLCKISLPGYLYTVSIRDLSNCLYNRFLGKISVLFTRSLYKIFTRGLLARSLHGFSTKDFVRISAQALLHRISATTRVIWHTPKMPRGLHERFQNENRPALRAIWHALSAEKVAQAISKWALRHNERDPTHPRTRPGCSSTSSNFT